MTGFRIIKMTEKHLDFVEKAEIECFSKPWSRQQIQFELNNPNSRFLILYSGENTAAYGSFRFAADTAYINNIAVISKYRRIGAGSAVLNSLITEAKSLNLDFITLEVRTSNTAAILLYENAGFKNCGIRPKLYNDPTEDGIIMTKELR